MKHGLADAFTSRADLGQELCKRVSRFPNLIPLSRPAEYEQRWLLASALQKSTRRGHAEAALIAADSLLHVDPVYLWRRLRVIALEDVGFGNPVACALVFEAGRNRNFRMKLGERKVLAVVVDALATGTKDRTLCDLSLFNHIKAPAGKGWAEYIDRLDMPWILKYLAVRGRTAENLGVQVPILYRKMPNETRVQAVAEDDWGDEIIGGVLAATFDMHTHQGKRSFAYFAKACRDAGRFFRENSKLDMMACLGNVVFEVEGAHLDQYLDWEGRRELSGKANRHWHLKHCFESPEQIAELREIVKQNRELLNQCRRRVV